MQSLHSFFDLRQIQCLNEAEEFKAKDFLQVPGGVQGRSIKSDSDEQLLIIIPFNCHVKLHSLILEGPDESAPSKIKLFNNQPNMDFSNASSLLPAQELTLTKQQTKQGSGIVIPLKFVKFQNIQTISIFVESNHGNSEVTIITKLDLLGQNIIVEGTKMDPSRVPAFSRVSATDLLDS